jgi:NTP pyrophosphatase (non-canonical NTP hydrolase)
MNELIQKIRAFNREREWEQFHSPKNLAMALSVEVAEVVEHFQWLTEEQSRDLPHDKWIEMTQEIADVMILLTNLADELGIDPIAAAIQKIEINKRKYPAKLAKGRALKYTEF